MTNKESLQEKVLPEHWRRLLEEIQKSRGNFSGLSEKGKYVGVLESLRARRLVKRLDDGKYHLTSAGDAVLQEEQGEGVLARIGACSKILDDIRTEMATRERLLQHKLRQPRLVGKENFQNIFIIAKLWNSATPIFPPSDVEASMVQMPDGGGGYILLWGETCLCIDPGLNFLTRFYRRCLTPNDIDGIIVTHDHFDHTRDVEGLLSLLYELNKKGISKRVDFLASQGTLTKYEKLLEIGTEIGYIKKMLLRPGQTLSLPQWGNRITLKATRAVHDENHANSPVGLLFELKQPGQSEVFKLGITGDTAWSRQLYSDFSETDLLVAHLGTVEKDGKFLKRHLGVKGLGLLISGIQPDLTIVTEFGEEVGDRRYQLCKTLSQVTGSKVLPGVMETEIRLPTLEGRIGHGKPFSPLDAFMKDVYRLGGINGNENEK